MSSLSVSADVLIGGSQRTDLDVHVGGGIHADLDLIVRDPPSFEKELDLDVFIDGESRTVNLDVLLAASLTADASIDVNVLDGWVHAGFVDQSANQLLRLGVGDSLYGVIVGEPHSVLYYYDTNSQFPTKGDAPAGRAQHTTHLVNLYAEAESVMYALICPPPLMKELLKARADSGITRKRVHITRHPQKEGGISDTYEVFVRDVPRPGVDEDAYYDAIETLERIDLTAFDVDLLL